MQISKFPCVYLVLNMQKQYLENFKVVKNPYQYRDYSTVPNDFIGYFLSIDFLNM